MTSKIFRSTVIVAMVVLLSSLCVMMGALYNHFSAVQVEQLKEELSLAATGTEQYGNAFLENVETRRFRITWIDSDGRVLFDTAADHTSAENHGDREEVREAAKNGTGSSVRTSSTLKQRSLYEARRLKDGTILRIAAVQASAWLWMVDILGPILLIILLAVALSAFLARRMARRIVDPLNGLDLDHPLKNEVYEEISPLLHRINRQHNQIAAQIETMRRRANEFAQISWYMQEGLALLNSDGTVLNINPTAKRLFQAGDDCVGKNFLSIDRSGGMRAALNDALDRGRGFTRGNRNGREYEFDLSRIESDGTVIGVVVLAFDITERMNAEQLRREFSANVSHELKTPLQSIIGSAELLESGMVREEDRLRFVGHIRKEASRLVNLVEDIIRLSQLDEGVELPMEEVELLDLADEVCDELKERAREKNVRMEIAGEGFAVSGVRRLLYEIVYNLCDNAIKYNVAGGSVLVLVQDKKLSVTDTGIGIPEEHRERVFERFYRVDKSHSKASGGTGLGLSIVKHAAAYHKASLHLESTPGQGTSVTVCFG